MHVQAFGNGTSAIYAALRALKCRDGKVIVPANICPSVLSAIYHSSNMPLFVDIERERWGLDPSLLEEQAGAANAVIAVHMFGIPCLIDKIGAVCRSKDLPLIEDCAQAEGARYDGRTVGASGDIAVFSYGAGKIISAGGGGSAATRDANLLKGLKAEHDALPAHDESAHAGLSRAFKKLYNTEYPELPDSSRRDFSAHLRQVAAKLLARHDPARDAEIARGIAGLSHNITGRLENVRRYQRRLASVPGARLMSFPEGAAPWRCNLLLEFSLRQKILKAMLAAGKNVSSWYPDMSGFLDPASFVAADLPNSRWLDRHVLNLWVEGGTSESQVDGACAMISALATSDE